MRELRVQVTLGEPAALNPSLMAPVPVWLGCSLFPVLRSWCDCLMSPLGASPLPQLAQEAFCSL